MSGRDDHGLTPVNICSVAAATDVSVLTFSSCHSFVGNYRAECGESGQQCIMANYRPQFHVAKTNAQSAKQVVRHQQYSNI